LDARWMRASVSFRGFLDLRFQRQHYIQ
jgi:hypothetical protein